MKNTLKLLLISLITLSLFSCTKERDEFDIVRNQGSTTVEVNGMILLPGEGMRFPNIDQYTIICIGECKVNINGGIY